MRAAGGEWRKRMKVSAKMKGQGRGIDVAREIWAKERTSEIASVREGS